VASGNDLIRHITERVVRYIDTPREVRWEAKNTGKPKEMWQYRWFGMLPVTVRVWKQSLEQRRKRRLSAWEHPSPPEAAQEAAPAKAWLPIALHEEAVERQAEQEQGFDEGRSAQMENACAR